MPTTNGDIPLNPPRSRPVSKARRSGLCPKQPGHRLTKGEKAHVLHVVKKVPLSKLARDETPSFIEQTKDWILRSLETRIQEAKGKKKVPRPMNSFFIYRFTFGEFIKSHFRVEDQTLVSQIVSASWGAESQAFKKEFKNIAKSERQHHALANPDYKFQPQPRQPSSLGKPTAQLRSNEFPGKNGEWSHNDRSQITTPIPVNYPSWGLNAGGILDDPPRLFVSERETQLQSYRFPENNGEWSHNDGSEITTPIPVDYPSWGFSAGSLLDDSPRLFVSEPETQLQSDRFLEHNGEWPLTDGPEINTPSPANDSSWGNSAGGIQDDNFAASGECFETYSCSGLAGVPWPGNCDLMFLDSMERQSFPFHLSNNDIWCHEC